VYLWVKYSSENNKTNAIVKEQDLMSNREALMKGIILHELNAAYETQALREHLSNFNWDKTAESILNESRALALGGKAIFKSDINKYLVSIFKNVKGDNLRQSEATTFDGGVIFPQVLSIDKLYTSVETNTSPDSLINKLLEDAGNFQEIEVESLLFLLEKYASTLPISFCDLPGVSLFDHIKALLAIAVSISEYANAKGTMELDREDRAFRLVGADISGIQNFIYDIASKNAAKNLKGRSFYLELLVNSLLQMVLKNFGLTQAHVIYASGGGFFLLLPNLPDLDAQLGKLRKELATGLYKQHKTKLFLALDSVELTGRDLITNGLKGEEAGLTSAWKTLMQKLNQQKRSRYSELLAGKETYKDFFCPGEVGGTTPRDSITNEEFDEEENKEFQRRYRNRNMWKKVCYLSEDEGVPSDPVKFSTYEYIEMGRQLRDADFWINASYSLDDMLDQKGFNPCEMGVFHYFVSKRKLDELIQHSSFKNDQTRRIRILSLNNTGAFHQDQQYGVITGFTFYGGNRFPQDDRGYPVTTDIMAGQGSFKRIGMLRMDVDNLGQLFITGFSEGRKTLSLFSALSRNLDWFFKGYLNTIVQPYVDRKEAYIIYSGGDDLFVIGNWSAVLDIAKKIRLDFVAFTQGNDQLSISGGMVILPARFPIVLGAEYAARAEKAAKNYTCQAYIKPPDEETYQEQRFEKNALSLFGIPWHWEHEFSVIEDLKNGLKHWVKKGGKNNEGVLPEGFLRRIKEHADAQHQQKKYELTQKWYWTVMYDFAQIAKRIKPGREVTPEQAKEAKDYVRSLSISAIENTHGHKPTPKGASFLRLLSTSARWLELENRTDEK
jgi:CRISPR-associated protein Csm1